MISEAEKQEHIRLTKIAQEVEQILAKHDVTGHLCLVSESMSHFLYKLDASWSAASIEENRVNLKCTKEQGYTPEQVAKRVRVTVQMLAAMLHLLQNDAKNFAAILLELSAKYDILSVVQPVDETDVEEEGDGLQA